ncbi:MAG: hypothetical protein AEth_01593 [Candidatus Argoarchaeum ethanivorans]|uniref:DUF4868 domain-containing protein n=1 Tax=Candidatus Argoarchaeum ethanivorans TaxID=2608793 RepID=A0A8B3S1W9_9EURY|nr:MAG: hypothetical protein AEth_01593 [Candidatus Argoarchaeum ethanivorans]
MNLNFDISNIKVTEFGIGRDDGNGRDFDYVMVDGNVQDALREMAGATWSAMQAQTNDPPNYDPSEKHASIEYTQLPLNDNMAETMRNLHEANNLSPNSNALADTEKVFCYFARFTDSQQRKLTAVRRATQFKGVLKSRLLRLDTNALKLIKKRVFKLDHDFDLLIDSENVHIFHPSGFEFVGQLQEAIMSAVSTNVAMLKAEISFMDFDVIEMYASKHPRAARYLASIRSKNEAVNIDSKRLQKLCAGNGVELTVNNGMLSLEKKQVMEFLEVLERRRYEIELVADTPEHYRAASRSKIDTGG